MFYFFFSEIIGPLNNSIATFQFHSWVDEQQFAFWGDWEAKQKTTTITCLLPRNLNEALK